MEIQEIADKLVSLCREGKNEEAYKTLFAENASAHDHGNPNAPIRTGLSNLLEGYHYFQNMIKEVNSSVVTDPTIISPHYFACGMGIDYTGTNGERHVMNELCVYEVRNGKIAKEIFYYG
mgnify:CR=1 FL=1|jgi:hypothetical protein